MTPEQRANLDRLLAPRHIAFIGGDAAVSAAQQCATSGFAGEIWGVNPKPGRFGEIPSFANVEHLPQAPDAVFLAVPRHGVSEVLAQLRNAGAGGIVCYTAGFKELGGQGADLERDLIAACGEMALAGPNVFGLLNYVSGAHLWPFSHGGKQVTSGPAIISQSGMLSSYLLTNRRSIHFSYVIGAGNQSILGVEDYLDSLVDNDAVTGFGLYIEMLRDIPRFADAVARALARKVPVVALKVGQSELASQTTLTHTGSLAGQDVCYQALFDRIGVARALSPSLLLETLQMLTTAGAPAGKRLAAFTCSGGDVAMLADCADSQGLIFDSPDAATEKSLRQWLPDIATVGNPLDYTTPLWGQEETLKNVFSAALAPGYDAALLVQDYPPIEISDDRPYYQADARAFIHATQNAGIPAAVCSSLPENLDHETQATLINNGIAPLQGISEATIAISASAVFGRVYKKLQSGSDPFIPKIYTPDRSQPVTLDEWQGKQMLRTHRIPVPPGELVNSQTAGEAACRIGFPVALKLVNNQLPHKTEAGVVRLNLANEDQVCQAAREVLDLGSQALGQQVGDQLLVEQMLDTVLAELLVGVQNDPQFGLVMTLAGGGTLVELMADSTTILLPTDRSSLRDALASLKVMRLLEGYRNRPHADVDQLLDILVAISEMAHHLAHELIAMDINPLLVTQSGCFAADTLIQLSHENLLAMP